METTNTVKRVSRSSRGSSSQLILQDLLMFSSSLTSLSGPADKHHRSLMLPPPCGGERREREEMVCLR